MKKLIFVAVLAMITSGCAMGPYYRPGTIQWRVDCELRYPTEGEQTACLQGQSQKDAEIKARREDAAYRRGRGANWRRYGRYGVNSYSGSILRQMQVIPR
jgi:hypothetical protein